MLKRIIFYIINTKYQILIYSYYSIKFYFTKKEKLAVYDLDNTLFHTWSHWNKKPPNWIYSNAYIFDGMKKKVNQSYKKNETVLFLTARNLRYILPTIQRLKKEFPKQKWNLVFVHKVSLKIKYLKMFHKKLKEITYYDDLSYNHENGEIKYYDSVIEEVKKIPIKYIDYQEILKINKVK